jgi:polar amino acid transport system substrate-binding protein
LPERDAHARHLPYAYLQYDLVLAVPPSRSYASLASLSSRARAAQRHAWHRLRCGDRDTTGAAGCCRPAGVVNDFETVFAKLEMGRADGTLATPPIYGKYLKGGKLQSSAVVIPLPEATPRFSGIYLAKATISPLVRDRYAGALKAMVADQTIRTIYARYFDEATLKRMFRQGPGPLLAALSAPDD